MLPHGYEIRLAMPADIAVLPEIERIAGLLFKTYSAELQLTDEIYNHVNSVETFEEAQRARHLWVAVAPGNEIVGFALVLNIGGCAHLDELDVLPSHGRQGVGSALLGSVCSWARDAGYPAVTLRTFREVPWNGPFYERRGFRVVRSSELSTEHLGLETVEQQKGLRTDLRVTMACATAERH